MTIEGYITILIAFLGSILFFRDRNNYLYKKDKFRKRNLLEIGLFIVANIAIVFYCSRIIIALAIINTLIWIGFMRFMKVIKYRILFWISIFTYWLYLYATYSNFESISVDEVWKLTLFVWSTVLLLVLIYEALGRFSKVFSAILSIIIGFCVLAPPFVFVLYNQAFNLKMNVAQLNAIFQSNLNEAYEFTVMYASGFQLALIPIMLSILGFTFFYISYSNVSVLKWRTYSNIVIFLFIVSHLNLIEGLSLPSFV